MKDNALHQEVAAEGAEQTARATGRTYRIGLPSYLVTRPLVHGMDELPQMDLIRTLPSNVKSMLAGGELDAALLPSIDLPSFGPRLSILPAGCLAGNGRTLMAKIFSQVKPENLTLMWAERNSYATVALVQVLWAAQYHRTLSIIPYDSTRDPLPKDAQSVLLVGDQVVCRPAMGFDWHLDPVSMWHEMTGLPFVFSVWATLSKNAQPVLFEQLLAARLNGHEHIQQIAADYAEPYGWPLDLAVRCMGKELQYEFTDAHREGLEEFLELASQAGLIQRPGPLSYYKP